MEPQKQEKGLVKYQARDGQEITLSFDNIRRYLVQGNRDKVSEQELMYFLAICKSRGLNPFKKDAYLIKYGDDPAAIVTSIDYFRSRARAQKDCKGWKKGIIVQKKGGELRDSAGLILEGETLLGGFFEAQPEGWTIPQRLEVNLNGYIKKTKEGKITRFWQPENQPTMIAKVAEAQGLRTLWPDEFQGIHEEAEIASGAVDLKEQQDGSFAMDGRPSFEDLSKDLDQAKLAEFVKLVAENNSATEEAVKANAAGKFEDFKKAFDKWTAKQIPKSTESAYPFSTLKATGIKEWWKSHATELRGAPIEEKKAWNKKVLAVNLMPAERGAMFLVFDEPKPDTIELALDDASKNDQVPIEIQCPDHPGETRKPDWCSTNCPHPPCENYERYMGMEE